MPNAAKIGPAEHWLAKAKLRSSEDWLFEN
jgi:hypothetical protein